MKISEIIAKFEAAPDFAKDPEIRVALVGAEQIMDIEGVVAAPNGNGVHLVVEHQCTVVEPVDRYYWNGKLLDAMDRDELQTALVMMLNQTPVAKIAVSGQPDAPEQDYVSVAPLEK